MQACLIGNLSNQKNNETWELVQIGVVGRRKIKKVPQVSVGNSSTLGGLQKSKKSQVPECIKD